MTRSKASSHLPILTITMGDPAGVGPEIAIRAVSEPETYRICRPLIVGDRSVIEATLLGLRAALEWKALADVAEADFQAGRIDLIDLGNVDLKSLKKGEASAMAGKAAYEYILRATDLALAGRVDGLVTCPINKEAIRQAGYPFPGHTEILADRTDAREFGMMLVSDTLRVVLVTIHLALEDAIRMISEDGILRAIRLGHGAGLMMSIDSPRIAVVGLNPHAGEEGMFGRQEIEIIGPAVKKAKRMGYNVQGPFPSDSLFYRALRGEFDLVIAMYHDQGLIPIKLIGFGKTVNVTLGLPIIRTSVDHGTAFDIAWQFRANPGSLLEAIRLAARMAATRRYKKIEPVEPTGRTGLEKL
jgi:4-hydroxythreonine-4-phosphate dehydrogenase